MKNILCVRLDNLGDVLMTTPAFRALKAINSDVRLTLLTSSRGAGIARFIPEIDEVIEFDVPWVKLDGAENHTEAVFRLIERLRGFDAAVIFTVFSQNPLPAAMLCYLAEVPVRVGYCRENPYGLLTHWLPDTEPFSDIQHEVTRQLHLVKMIGAETNDNRLSLLIPPDSRVKALEKTVLHPDQRWFVLHPGVSERKRQYPPEAYIEAGQKLHQHGFQIVVTGVESERTLAERIAAAVGGISLAGELPLAEFIGLISAAPLLVSNNTGPVHIAAAVGTPVVVMYAHTNPQHTPWNVAHRVLYFDVPLQLRSRNSLLQYTDQKTVKQPDATPQDLVEAVLQLSMVTIS